MILVGPRTTAVSQAHYEAGQYLEEQLGATMISLDKVNTADRPDTTVDQVIDDMVADGAQLIFATSDDMRDGAAMAPQQPGCADRSGPRATAPGRTARRYVAVRQSRQHDGPDVLRQVHCRLCGGADDRDRAIGYLGPLINDETRRLANSAFLGAQYCWENYRGVTDHLDLHGQLDRVLVQDPRLHPRSDPGGQRLLRRRRRCRHQRHRHHRSTRRGRPAADAGEAVWAVPYDYEGACDEARNLPRRSVLQLGTRLPDDRSVRHRRHFHRRVELVWPGLDRSEQQ